MKKSAKAIAFDKRYLLKILLMSNLSILLLFCSVFTAFAGESTAQKVKLNIELTNAPLNEVISEIKTQTNFEFAYEADLGDMVLANVSVNVNNESIENVLGDILEGSKVNYRVIDRIILLSKNNLQTTSEVNKSSLAPVKVSGTVTNEKGEPIPGASIIIKGTTNGTVTDVDGKYTLEVTDATRILVFSFIGMTPQEITVGAQSVIDVVLVQSVVSLNEVVVIGYGSQRKVEVTSAAVSVKSKDFVKGAVKDAGQLLQGKIAGLIIGTSSANPKATSEIMLRGTGTLNSSVSPLVLIDGIPGGLNTVAPDDIESIDVLKDASAAAIYGTRGSNGVILITTKSAKGDIEPTVTYSGYFSTQSFKNLPDMLTADQYRMRLEEGTSGFMDRGSSTDWVKEISRQSPISQNHNVSIHGGNGKTNYLASFGYRKDEGIILTTEASIFNSRVDVNHKMLNDKLLINLNVIQNDSKGSADFDDVAFRSAVRYNPTAPVYNPDGTYFEDFGPTENFNPVAMINETFGGSHGHSARTSGSITWKPIDGLKLKMLTSRSKSNYINGLGHTKQHYTTTLGGKNGEAMQNYAESLDNLLELSGEYSKKINSHSFSALGGYSYQSFEDQNGGMYNYDYPVGNFSYIDNIGLGNALKTGLASMSSSKYVSNLIGFFGRATYNYKEKYLLMANLRYEAASQLLGTEQPWGLFPSFSAGWRLSEEEFMKGLTFINDLKLRGGYGVTGTAPDQSFLGVEMLKYSGSFFIDGKWVPSIVPASNANPYLKWEERHETNIGLDFSVLEGRLGGSFDFYNRQTKGLLFDYQVPSPPNLYGVTKANVGVMENKGFELLLSAVPVQQAKFSWTSNVTFSANNNKLVSLENDLYTLTTPYFDDGRSPTPIGEPTHRIEVGQPIGNFYGYEVNSVTADGHWIYSNKHGRDTLAVSPEDRKVIGNGIPKYYASWNNTFKYGNLDLQINMRGAFGFQIMNATRMLHENPGFDSYNLLNSAYDKVFGTAVLARDVNVQNNSYYVEEGDYWKIDNLVLGYTFNTKDVKHLPNIHLYVSAKNVITFTKYKGMDPEVTLFGTTGSQRLTPGYDNRERYPTSRVFTVGMNVTFK